MPMLDLIVSLFSYQMNAMGSASLTVDASVFFNTKWKTPFLWMLLKEGTGEVLADLNLIISMIFTRPPL